MRDTDPKTDAGAHGIFPLLDDLGNGLAILFLDRAAAHQLAYQFVDRLPTIRGLKVRHDMLGLDNFTQCHFVCAFRMMEGAISRLN